MSIPFSTIRQQLNDVLLLSDTADPSAGAGVVAPIGSKYWRGTAQSGDYTKTGAGNTAWTIVPTGIYFNVLDYGADNSGATNTTAQINEAIADAAVNGGTVFFPPGTYQFTELSIPASNIRFLGCGLNASVLRQVLNAGGGAHPAITVGGGVIGTEFELLTFNQSGLTNPGAGLCPYLRVTSAEIVKVIDCRFLGGVANAGGYIHAGDAGSDVTLIWICGGIMTDAAGPAIDLGRNVSKVWVLDNQITNASINSAIEIDDASNVIMSGNLVSSQGLALDIESTNGESTRVSITNNVLLGRLTIAGQNAFRLSHNEIYMSVAGDANAALTISNATYCQFQKNIIGRQSTSSAGLVVQLDTITQSQVQRNVWKQETNNAVLRATDLLTVQFASNMTLATNVASAPDAYTIRSNVRASENISIINEIITADAGEFARGINFIRVATNFANLLTNGNLLRNVDTGIRYDDGGAGVAAFGGFTMAAGNVISATTAAITKTVAAMPLRVAGNASTFGANIFQHAGDPNGVVTARPGSMCWNTSGGANTSVYVKESGNGNTGWIAK